MKKLVLSAISLMISAGVASPVLADDNFDKYPGDSSIYGVESSAKPNVLIIIDNSGSMTGQVPGCNYDPSRTDYTVQNICTNQPGAPNHNCTDNYVYVQTVHSSGYGANPTFTYALLYGTTTTTTTVTHDGYYTYDRRGRRTWHPAWTETVYHYTYWPVTVDMVPTSCGTLDPHAALTTSGLYSGYQFNPASSATTATCGSATGITYVTGRYINYLNYDAELEEKINIAKNVVKSLIQTTDNVNFGLMTYYRKDTGETDWWGNPIIKGEGGTFISRSVKFGTSASTAYETTIQDMNTAFPPGTTTADAVTPCLNAAKCTNRDALVAVSQSASLVAGGGTPLAETLLEAGRYFSGGTPAFGATVGVSIGGTNNGKYTTPVTGGECQKNFVIFITDGMSSEDDNDALTDIGTDGDTDGDVKEPGDLSHSLDDVAKYLNASTQNIISYFVGFGSVGSDPAAVALLDKASNDTHGKGHYYLAENQVALSNTLSTIMSQINSVNSSYVAPVVPVSPQNRTYGSSRVFMGFFRPNGRSYWSGNLKKYGLDAFNFITDKNGNNATWVDNNDDKIDDRDSISLELESGASNGTFKNSAQSFWSTSVDSGTVRLGGTGEVLKGQIGSRKLYTYTGTNTSLTDDSNQLSTANTNITFGTLDVADPTTKDKLLNFLQGQDVYNEDGDAGTTNRSWVMGDILHSRPLIINYNKYTFDVTAEQDRTQNKSMIFVGANDGFLHAFNDYDGSEAWAFAPPDSLGKLQNIPGMYHPVFADSSVSAYVYDKNNNGTIDAANDKVILMFGERRGGGTYSSPTNGHYYALDVSDPASPKYLWKISNTTSGFGEMGESWSEPKFVKMKITVASETKVRIVAFFGAGYDNPNEDSRYGATQGFTGMGFAAPSDTGAGAVTSSPPSNSASSPKGRGIYAVELATLDSDGVPTIDTSVTKIWSATGTGTATSPDKYYSSMAFSFPAEIASVDTDNNGYTDRLYAVDTGGNLWRFEVGDADPANWSAKIIFKSNPGSGATPENGRKIFYKPSVVTENGYRMVFFATGDREHPLNTNVIDAIYAFKDPDDNSIITTAKTENDLVDVTTDALQDTAAANATALSNEISSIFSQLNSTSKFGWLIKLNETGHAGEKVLASPTVFNKVLYLTTYAPSATTEVTTSCTGNLGTARLYAMDYKTGEAVFNYDTDNGNITSHTTANSRAADSSGHTLTRSDRTINIGSGIPSGVVVLISAGGQTNIMAGVGGKIVLPQSKSGGTIIPLYWRQK